MMRVDLLLNPGTPPSSPVQDPVQALDTPDPIVPDASLSSSPDPASVPVPVVMAITKGKVVSSKFVLPSELFTASNHRTSNEVDEDEKDTLTTAVKRVRRELPGVRLLLQCVDNQRQDAADERPEIFAGNAFWGQVAALNPPTNPLDRDSVPAQESVSPPSLMEELVAASVSVEQTQGEHITTSEEDDQSATSGCKRKKFTICKEPGCKSQALSKQLCMKHGGGPRCSVPYCHHGAKLKNLCFQHGGSTICLAPGCSSKAKRFGYCWSHGGGRICGEEDCNKVAAQGGMCWAHGGGNRCKLQGCSKRSYKQHDYYCKRHVSETVADY